MKCTKTHGNAAKGLDQSVGRTKRLTKTAIATSLRLTVNLTKPLIIELIILNDTGCPIEWKRNFY